MPIEYQIDPERRIVQARAHGMLRVEELWDYQQQVWSAGRLAGFDELMDMSEVEQIESPTGDRVKALAELAAQSDAAGPATRFAIIAPTPLAFGLGRMFQAYRSEAAGSTREVGVFRTRAGALEFLDRSAPAETDS